MIPYRPAATSQYRHTGPCVPASYLAIAQYDNEQLQAQIIALQDKLDRCRRRQAADLPCEPGDTGNGVGW